MPLEKSRMTEKVREGCQREALSTTEPNIETEIEHEEPSKAYGGEFESPDEKATRIDAEAAALHEKDGTRDNEGARGVLRCWMLRGENGGGDICHGLLEADTALDRSDA